MKHDIIIFFSLILLCASCDRDFIELSPKDQLSGATFFRTENDFRQALAAAYVPLRTVTNYDYVLSEMRSDNAHYQDFRVNRGSGYVQRENIADFTDNALNALTNGGYYACFGGISRANEILSRIDASTISAEAKADIGGQARFLRAFYYFKLVRWFGGVPLFTSPATTAEEAFLPRATEAEVYALIIADASQAVEQLTAPAAFPQSGLATKGSATMLLADVYLYQHNYAAAEPLLKTLPEMGYGLHADYADAFLPANKNSKESIFEIQYHEGLTAGQQSNFIYVFLPRSTNTTVITGVQTDNTTTGGYNTPTQDLIASYEPGDKRLDASIAIAEGTYNASMHFTFTANRSVVNYQPTEGVASIPYAKKYLHAHSNPNNTDDNWPVYRYAEALLALAEVLNEQGRGGEALPYLNQVRDRAFGAGVSPITTTDQQALRDIILHERRVELAFENKRWSDLVRSGRAVEVMTAFGSQLKKTVPYIPADAFSVEDFRLKYPIPFEEISLNPGKTIQNPGYF